MSLKALPEFIPVRVEFVPDDPDMLAAVAPAGDTDATVPDGLPDDTPVDDTPVDDTAVDDTPVPDGLLPMKPSSGVALGVPCEDSVVTASVLEGADVADGSGLDTSVSVDVVPYVPPRSSLMVLSAVPPVGSVQSSTVTV